MKTHAPESRGKNTRKPSTKQGQNRSQLGQLAKLLNLDPGQMEAIISAAEYDKMSLVDFFKSSALSSAQSLAEGLEHEAKLSNGVDIAKSLFITAGHLETAIAENFALTNLIRDTMDVQSHHGPWGEDYARKMSYGIYELTKHSNARLEAAFKTVWAEIVRINRSLEKP